MIDRRIMRRLGIAAIQSAEVLDDHPSIFRTQPTCLLYTSDAADERSSVDLGGRRIIKKKKRRRTWRHTIRETTEMTHRT